jgi:hypothetical protein
LVGVHCRCGGAGMATLTLELEDDVLARAEAAAARLPGRTLEGVLVARVEELAEYPLQTQAERLETLRNAFRLADLHGGYLEGGMPDSEERNAR